MRLRKGWYKKARRKFVRKRVFSWRLCQDNCIGWWYKRSRLSRKLSQTGWSPSSEHKQVMEKLNRMSFAKGFWYARKWLQRHPFNDGKFDFYFLIDE